MPTPIISRNKLVAIFLFGLISGFTLIISGNSLNFWLARDNIDLQSISLFAFISLPYAVNFLVAPALDIVELPYLRRWLGHRLSWIFLLLLLLAITIFILSLLDPRTNIWLFAFIALSISFFSATKDSILGALRTELIRKESQGSISGLYIFGYRTGMLISGYGSIYFSYYIGWQNVYKLLALSVILLLIILTYCLKKLRDELDLNNPIKFPISCHVSTKNGFFQNIISPIGSVYLFILITSFLLLYRLPDDCISIMINPFLLHLGYHELEIANLGKLLGIISAVIGGFAASFVMRKKSIIDSLLIFGILHAMSHLLFIILGFYGKNQFVLFITIGVEGVTSGMNMAAYIAFISSICSGRFKATQYSFFSSMMGLSRSIFPAFFGYMLINQGFNFFFSFVIFATIPALLILLKIRRKFAMLHNL